MLKLDLQYFAEGVEIEYDGETSNLSIGKQARFACKDKSMPSDIVIKNKGVGEISGVTVTKDKVLEGETFYGSNGLEEGTMPNNGYIDGDYGATLDLNFTKLLLNGAYRGSVSIYPQEVTIVPSDISQEISPAEGCVLGKVKVEKIPPADEWDGSGIVIAPIEPVEPEQPMTFTINGASYQMENRMTWYEWCQNLDYNTDNFRCTSITDYVYEAESKNQVTDADGNDVLGTTYIVEGGAYLIKEAVTEDELAGTWVLNSSVNPYSSTLHFNNINGKFTAKSHEGTYYIEDFTTISLSTGSSYIFSIDTPQGFPRNRFYNSKGNIFGYDTAELSFTESPTTDLGVSLRTFTITSKLSEVTNGSTLLTWLKANATKQGGTNVNIYDITVNNNTVFKANSDNPTQIKAGETVTLSFSTDGPSPTVAVSATNATRSFSYGTRSLTVTLSNATGDVVLTIDETDPEPV